MRTAREILEELEPYELAALKSIVDYESRKMGDARVRGYQDDIRRIINESISGKLVPPTTTTRSRRKRTTVAFRSVEIKDFGPFRGHALLRFPDLQDAARPVTMILAENGAGKSSLSDAIQWTLYGGSPQRVSPIVHESSADEYEAAEAFVAVEFVTPDGAEYRCTRCIKKRDRDENGVSSHVYARRRDNWEKMPEKAETIVGEIFPESLRRYIFTTGEALSHVQDEKEQDRLAMALHHVLGIRVLERAKAHLPEVAKSLQAELKRFLRGASSQKEALLSQLQEEGRESSKQLEGLNQKIEAGKRNVKIIDEQLLQLKTAAQRQEARTKAIRRRETAEGRMERLVASVCDLLQLSAVGVIYDAHIAPRVEGILDRLAEERELPPPIQRSVIARLLEEERCLCGRPLTDAENEARACLGTAIASAAGPGVDSGLASIQGFMSEARMRTKELVGERGLDGLHAEIRTIEAEIRDARHEIQQITEDLSSDPEAEVKALERKRRETEEVWQEAVERRSLLMQRAEPRKEEIRGLEADLKKAASQEERAQHVGRAYQCSTRLRDVLGELYVARKAQAKNRVNELLLRYPFGPKKLVGQVSEDFRLYSMRTASGAALEEEPSPSTGESLATALALIRVLSDLHSGNDGDDTLGLGVQTFPTVLDAPTAPLGSTMIDAISEWVREVIKQPILLMNDEHWGAAREALGDSIGACAVIEMHAPGRSREVELPDGRKVAFVVTEEADIYSKIVQY